MGVRSRAYYVKARQAASLPPTAIGRGPAKMMEPTRKERSSFHRPGGHRIVTQRVANFPKERRRR